MYKYLQQRRIASPKFSGAKKIGGGQILVSKVILFGIPPLKAQMLDMLKIWGPLNTPVTSKRTFSKLKIF